MTISQARLKELFAYDPETGIFTCRKTRCGRAMAGMEAGGIDDRGYVRIKIDGKKYRAHRLAWLYVYGVFPKDSLDHINMSRADNRIANLREATCGQNAANRKVASNSTSGVKGVSWSKQSSKWKAQISFRNRKRHLGLFENIEEAKAAYDQAAVALFGEYARAA